MLWSGLQGGVLSQAGFDLWGLFQSDWFCEKSTDSSTAYTLESILTVLLYLKYLCKASHRKPLCPSLSVSEHKLTKVGLHPCVYSSARRLHQYMLCQKSPQIWRKNYLSASCLIRVRITFHLPQRQLLQHFFTALLCYQLMISSIKLLQVESVLTMMGNWWMTPRPYLSPQTFLSHFLPLSCWGRRVREHFDVNLEGSPGQPTTICPKSPKLESNLRIY